MNPYLYNSRVVDTFLKLIATRYPSIKTNELLNYAGIKDYEVSDQGCWFTQEQVDSFYEKLVQLTGNEEIAREAGRFSAAPESLGVLRQHTLGLVGPARAFQLIKKSALNFTRSSIYESRSISNHSVEITVTPHEGVVEKPYQCENRIGFFEATLMLFGRKIQKIAHPECLFKGDNSCRYIIAWENSPSWVLKRIGAGASLLFVMASLILLARGDWSALLTLLYLFVPGSLLLLAGVATVEKKELVKSLDFTNKTAELLIKQIDANFNNSHMLNDVGQVLSNCVKREDILDLVTKILKNRMSYDCGMVLLATSGRDSLLIQKNYGYSVEHLKCLDKLFSGPDLSASKEDGLDFLSGHTPFLYNDLNEIKEGFSQQLFDFFKSMGAESFICCPIITAEKTIGLLSVVNLSKKEPLVSSDVSLMMGIASILGVSLRNIELIDEKLQHEKEQLKIEKLESLGVLAGGIAHDFNNILTGILGNISFAQMFLDSSHKAYKPLREAEQASVRAGELAYQLLTFARGGEPIKKVVSLRNLADETVSLVLRGSNVKAEINISDSVYAINADAGQLSQVFHNIIINATQAMPAGGMIMVGAQNVSLSSENDLVLPAGVYVKLVFKDSGCGIPDDVLSRIFDPYYTTKSAGSGLGLASVFSIIKKHSGHIGVTSALGKGTTFTVHLPSIGETYPNYQAQQVAQTAGEHTGGAILVMDDEINILEMVTEILEYLGYQVTTCKNGSEAIETYAKAKEAGTPFSMVILDLTIPGGMGGKEAAQKILALNPAARLVVSSGYSNDPIVSDPGQYGFSGAVVKPYKIQEFGKIISQILSNH